MALAVILITGLTSVGVPGLARAGTATIPLAASSMRAAAVVNRTALAAGQRLTAGSRLISPDLFVTLNMQSDGNLTIRAGGHLVWATRTTGRGNYLQMNKDGNIAVFNARNRPVWAAHTPGAKNHLVLQNNGDLILRRPNGVTGWSLGTRANELDAVNGLRSDQYLTGKGGEVFKMQSDGALVLRRGATVLWDSNTQGHPGAHLDIRPDGNAVLYAANQRVLWTSGRAGAKARLVVAADGNLALQSANGTSVWQTYTGRNSTAAGFAGQLLSMWGGKVGGLPGVRADLVATRSNQTVVNSCGQRVRVDIRVVRFLAQLTARYRIKLNNIITGHSCDSGGHPKGRAVDIATVTVLSNGASTSFGGRSGPNNRALDAAFVNYVSTLLPNGAGLGQRYCAGQSSAHPRAGVQFFDDVCNHQHVQVQPSR